MRLLMSKVIRIPTANPATIPIAVAMEQESSLEGGLGTACVCMAEPQDEER